MTVDATRKAVQVDITQLVAACAIRTTLKPIIDAVAIAATTATYIAAL
jgi:hypothetical protein